MQRFTKEQCKAAQSLAIRYHAFKRAHLSEDWEAVLCWAPMLREIQDETGAVLEDREFVDWVLRIARREAVTRHMAYLEAHEGFDCWPGDALAIRDRAICYVGDGLGVMSAVDKACEAAELEASLS